MNKSLVLITLLTLFSCGKDEQLFIPDNTFSINQEVLLSQLVETPRSYKISIAKETYLFIDTDGTIIEIPQNSLLDKTGSPVFGEVKIEFLELTGKKSSMLYGPTSSFQNASFDPKKEVFLKFTKDDEELVLKDGIKIYLPEEENLEKNLLKLLMANKDQIDKTGWSLDDVENAVLDIQDWEISYKDNLISGKGFVINVKDKIHWYSIGSFSESATNLKINMCVEIGDEFDTKNSLVYFLSSNMNTAIKINQSLNSSQNICQNNLFLPDGIQGNFIVISYLGNDSYYFGMTNAVIKNESLNKVNSERKTIKEIREILSSL